MGDLKKVPETGFKLAQRLVLGGLIVGVVAIWGLRLTGSNAAADHRAGGAPPFIGISRQFTQIKPVRPAPLHPLKTADGGTIDLSRYKGKVVLLNFWATWCAPCIREMPALDRLAERLGGPRFAVVAVSIDRLGFAKVTPFLKRLKVDNLAVYLDASRKLYRAFGVRALPTTMLIDHQGNIRGYLEGRAEWDSKKAEALIRYYIGHIPEAKKRGRAGGPKGRQ